MLSGNGADDEIQVVIEATAPRSRHVSRVRKVFSRYSL